MTRIIVPTAYGLLCHLTQAPVVLYQARSFLTGLQLVVLMKVVDTCYCLKESLALPDTGMVGLSGRDHDQLASGITLTRLTWVKDLSQSIAITSEVPGVS